MTGKRRYIRASWVGDWYYCGAVLRYRLGGERLAEGVKKRREYLFARGMVAEQRAGLGTSPRAGLGVSVVLLFLLLLLLALVFLLFLLY
ncbi:MAG: hypothetical protein C4292_02340 [Nitrososphaera sp.]